MAGAYEPRLLSQDETHRLMFRYTRFFRERLESELRKRYGSRVREVHVGYTVDGDSIEVRAEASLLVSEDIGQELHCIDIDAVTEDCIYSVADSLGTDEVPDDMVSECVDMELEAFREEYGGKPFEFHIAFPPFFMARLETIEDEDAGKYCILDLLVAEYKHTMNTWWLNEIMRDKSKLGEYVERIVEEAISYIDRVFTALKVVAGV